jgi:hypothetical protein
MKMVIAPPGSGTSAIPAGPARLAFVAGPSSPPLPKTPLPATVDIDVAVRCDLHVAWHVQVCGNGRAAVADVIRVARRPVARDRVDESGLCIHHAYTVVQGIGDVEIAVRRTRDGARRVQCRGQRGLIVTIEPVLS